MMNHVGFASATRLALATIFFCCLVFGQSDLGSISGFVKDPSGSVIPNAKVSLRNESGLDRTVNTDGTGFYIVTNIPPGLYSISVEAAGFKKYESSGNKLESSSKLELNATLTVGASTETVEVSATAQQLQTESASVQRAINRQQIDSLELNGRNPIFMANLVPGTRGGNLAGLSFNFSQGPSNINGARTPESLITYDGAPAVRTRSNGTSLGAADVDSTTEVQVLTASYNAEFGRSSGGQIRIITRSGTDAFHGAAYDYVRNTVFNANTWSRNQNAFTAFTAPINYNQYGFNIGGPAYIPGKFNADKSKFFWYWGTEWVRYRFTDIAQWQVPSMAMRRGDFSELLGPNIYYNAPRQLLNPTTGAPIPGNIIPASLLSSSGLGILKAYPAPNLTVPLNGNQNFYGAAIHPQDQRKDTLAVDINVNASQRMQFRRNNFSFFEYQPLDGTPFATPKYFNRPNQTNSLNYVWTLSPTLINETLATVSLDDVYIPVDTAHFLDRTSVGITYPYIFPTGKLIPTRIPTANITGLNNGLNGGPYPSHSAGPIYNLSDSLTWVKGRHTFKFGALFERSGENDNDEINVSACPTCTNNQNGQFTFTDSRSGRPSSGSAIANVALGLFDTYSELGQRAYTVFRGSMTEAFAQDNWKASQKMTVYAGLRYTVIVPYSAQWRNQSFFDPALYDPSKAVTVDRSTGQIIIGAGDRYNGLVIPGSGWTESARGRFPEAFDPKYDYLFRGGKYPSYYSNIQWGNIQPRAGLAYQINGKTVIRAGGGRFFTRLGQSDSVFPGGNPPFQPTANVSFGSVDNPGGNAANVLPLTVTTQSRDFKNPEAFNWNVTLERELFKDLAVTVAYVGRRGVHLQRESNINQPTIATVLANPGVNIDALRPYKGYNSIRQTDNVANSRYNSLQLSANKRFSKGLLFGISYTYSTSRDDGSAQRDIIPDTYDAHNLWGYSDFDVRHIFIANYLYEIPFFKSRNDLLGRVVGGWQLSGIIQAQTGTPSSVAKSNDYAGVGQDGSLSNGGQFWMINGTPVITGNFAPGGASDPAQYFTVANSDGSRIFTAPAAGTFNTTQTVRNIIHNPGFDNWNVGLFKKIPVNERIGFQFRAEAFDVLNHPNWNGASFDPTSSTFGKVTGKNGDVRNMQLSLRLYF